jgi:O-antigen/teichoic acid export membrane protein
MLTKKNFLNIGALFFERALRIVATSILMFFLARYLSPNLFGQLSFAIAFTSVISIATSIGMDSVVVHELIIEKKPKNEVLGSVLWLRIFCGVVLIFLSNLGLLIFKADYQLSIIVFIISFGIIFQAFEVIDFYFQSILKFKKIINARIVSLFFSILLKIFFLYYEFGIIYIASSFLFDSLIFAIFLLVAYNGESLKIRAWKYKKTTAFYLIKKSIYLLVSGICVVLIMQIDKILLGFFSGNRELGIYSAATQFSGVWNIIPITMGAVLIPDATIIYAHNREHYEKLILNIFRYLTFIGICICFFIIILGEKIILLTLGEKYLESADLLSIHIFTILFIFHISIRTRLLIIEKAIIFITRIAILTVITSLFLNVYLINLMGAKGAAYATLISWGSSAVLFPLFWNRTRHYPSLFIKSFLLGMKK